MQTCTKKEKRTFKTDRGDGGRKDEKELRHVMYMYQFLTRNANIILQQCTLKKAGDYSLYFPMCPSGLSVCRQGPEQGWLCLLPRGPLSAQADGGGLRGRRVAGELSRLFRTWTPKRHPPLFIYHRPDLVAQSVLKAVQPL